MDLGVTTGLDSRVAGDLAARCALLGYHSLRSNDETHAKNFGEEGAKFNFEQYGIYYDDAAKIDGDWKLTRLPPTVLQAPDRLTGSVIAARSTLIRRARSSKSNLDQLDPARSWARDLSSALMLSVLHWSADQRVSLWRPAPIRVTTPFLVISSDDSAESSRSFGRVDAALLVGRPRPQAVHVVVEAAPANVATLCLTSPEKPCRARQATCGSRHMIEQSSPS
jgi:hypothetical protein